MRRCRRCGSKLNRSDVLRCATCETGWIYFIEAIDGGAVKVGWSTSERTARLRLVNLQTANHCELQIMGGRAGSYADEAALHRALAPHACLAGGSEWFYLNDDVREILDAFEGSSAWAPGGHGTEATMGVEGA